MRSRTGRDAEDATLRLVQAHAGELLRFARRFSHCADDAHDAYQRALEILIRRMRTDPPASTLSWLRTVIRHEALTIRAEREQLVGRVELDLDRHEDRALLDPAERAVGHERVRHTAEALRRLKPQEVTALVLRAEGLSYAEIGARMQWTYTKVNRCVTEGRRALLERLGAIESGAECARWLPQLSALADGEASAADLAQLRPHLRGCSACRATLRELHAVPARVALLVPPALVGVTATHGVDDGLAGHAGLGLHALLDRAALLVGRLQGAFETLPGAKVAAVAASTAALAGGGVALEHATQDTSAGSDRTGAAAVASGPAPSPDARATTIAFLRQAGLAASRAQRRAAGRGEFARRPAEPSEFIPGAPPRPEFAVRAPASPPPATAAASPAPDASSEFGSP
ncbi:MAG TPA: sigma-70 family RNA polymerase sigma factor [Conexibacter sp.]